MSCSALIFENVRFERGGFSLNVHANFPAGKLSVILGPSGSGKTTLLDLAAGFLFSQEGRILEGDRDVSGIPPRQRKAGVVFQDHALFPHMSAQDNVAYGLLARGRPRKESRKKAVELLERMELGSLAHRKPGFLSGGERQRVALSRALAIEPDILLLDEPFSALDTRLSETLRAEVRRIQKEFSVTALLVTHNQEEAFSLSDSLAVMNRGRIVQMGEPAELWRNPVDLFTADFLGRATFLKILRSDSDEKNRPAAVTPAGSIPLKKPIPELPATAVFRPEHLRIAENGCLQGRVTDTEFTGGGWRIRLKSVDGSPGVEMDVNFGERIPPAVNDVVRVAVLQGADEEEPVRILSGCRA